MSEARFVIRRHRRPWGTRYTFALIGTNGEPLVASEPYASKQAARSGIEAVRRAVPGAAVVDETA